MIRQLPVVLLLALATSSCVTAAQKNWTELSSGEQFKKEKAAFTERIGGKKVCTRDGINSFNYPKNRPSKDCIYTAAGYSITPDRNLKLPLNELKVKQVTSIGFLVEHSIEYCVFVSGVKNRCYDEPSPNLIFVHRTNEDGVVDGGFLDDTEENSRLYEYKGAYSYKTAIGGSKTVHSFEALPRNVLKQAQDGLMVYDPHEELLAELGLWKSLDKPLKKKVQRER